METRSTSLISSKRKLAPSSPVTTPLFSSLSRSKSWRSDIAFASSADDENSSRHTVKLLSSRRVFSPDPLESEEELLKSVPDSSFERRQIVQKKRNESTCLLNKRSRGFNYVPKDYSRGLLNPVDDEEIVQTTPPEAIGDSLGAAANAPQVADPIFPVEPAANYKQGRLNPQFRGRLVKSRVSFSYRRLLPYLMDFAKEDDSATTANACKKQQKTQGSTIPVQKAQEDMIFCSGNNPTANDSTKEVSAIIEHVNGGSSNESPRDLSLPNCESKEQNLKDGEDDGKIDHSLSLGKAPSENKAVEEDIQVHHPIDNNNTNVEEISKPCQREEEEETRGTKEVGVLSQIDDSEVSGGVSFAQGNNRLLQTSVHNNEDADFVTYTGSMKSNNKSPPQNKKMLLNPCSRLKLSKMTNNSFSYKRLLPYLMEIAKDNSAGAVSESSPSPTEEVKNTQQQQQRSPLHQFEEQAPVIMPPPSSIIISFSDSILLKDNNKASPASSSSTSVKNPHGLVLEASVTTSTSTRSQDEKLEAAYENEKEVDLISPVVEQPLTGGSPGTTEADRLILVQEGKPPPISVSESESSRVGSTIRGILKRRNPRGCRGLCTCLSCSSFRLNAERAFEFSKNQMKDTEEVAFALLKEVSHLSNVLQKLNQTTCHVMPNDQVEDVCVRASQVAEAAKDRLCVMKEDLNIHCRVKCLHPPSVTFNEP